MSTLHEQARAEAEREYPPVPIALRGLTYPADAMRESRVGAYVRGLLAGHEAASRPRQVTTVAELAALPVGTILLDKMGDVGKVDYGAVRYEETTPLSFEYVAKRYLPARVLYVPEEES